MPNGSDEDERIGDQLRAKINGKFQAAIFLGGFSFTILSIQLTILYTEAHPRWLPLSIGLMIAALMLYFRAIMLLDALTMPKMFWERAPNLQQGSNVLTKHDLRALKGRMVFYWTTLVSVAMVLTFLSLFAMVVPPIERGAERGQWWTLGSFLASLLAAFIYCGCLRRFEHKRETTDPEFRRLVQVVD